MSTQLKHISQIGSFPQVRVKIKHIWNHRLDANFVQSKPSTKALNMSEQTKTWYNLRSQLLNDMISYPRFVLKMVGKREK